MPRVPENGTWCTVEEVIKNYIFLSVSRAWNLFIIMTNVENTLKRTNFHIKNISIINLINFHK